MEEIDQFLVPAHEIRREISVGNSKFITTIAPARSMEEARTLINRVHKEFPDASHHVTAYVVGHGASQIAHCSDAGEPAGSAGRPSLAVLQGSGLGDAVVVVSRYFGGTKLGIGGLVRAYGDAVRSVIKVLPLARKIMTQSIKVEYEYPFVERIRKNVSIHSGLILSEDFRSEVTMMARIPVVNFRELELNLAEITNGKARIQIVDTGETLFPIDKNLK